MDYSTMTSEALQAEKNRLDEIVQSTRTEMRKIRAAQEPHLRAANQVGLGTETTIIKVGH